LKGYKSIEIENGEEPGTQVVKVITDGSAKVSKDDAVKSLGEKSEKYVVESWKKGESDS